MIRTQIQLTAEQALALKRRAAAEGVSMATVVRQAVDALLGSDEREEHWRRAFAVVGRFKGGGEPVSEEHDRYLEEAALDWRSS